MRKMREISPLQLIHLLHVTITVARCMYLPFIAIFLRDEFNISVSTTTIFLSFSYFIGLLGGFFLNGFSYVYNPIVLIIFKIMLIGILLFGAFYCQNIYIFFGIFSFINILIQSLDIFIKAIITEYSELENGFQGFSTRYVCLNIGYMLGPMIVTYFDLIGSKTAFLLSGLTYIFTGILITSNISTILYFYKQKKSILRQDLLFHRQELMVIGKDKTLLYVTLGSLCSFVVYGRYTIYLSQFVMDNFSQGETFFGNLIIMNSLIIIFFQKFLSYFLKKYNYFKVAILGLLVLAGGEFSFFLSKNIYDLFFSITIFTLGEMIFIPCESAIISKIAPPKESSTYFRFHSISNIGGFFGISIVGYLFEYSGAKIAFAMLTIFCFVGAIFFHFAKISWSKKIINK